MLSIYAISTPFIEVTITNEQGVNPTGDVVEFAFLGPYTTVSQANEAVPSASTTWYTGAWQSLVSPYVATILIGPGSGAAVLTAGAYLVLVRVTDSPEVPVLYSGPMVVT